MDLVMPVMDGYEATQRLKATEAGRATPVVAITASVLSDNERLANEAGADAYIRKPYREEEIFETLGRLLGLRYIYVEEAASKSAEPQEAAVRPYSVAALPKELLEAMRESLEEGDMGRLSELIGRVQEVDSIIAGRLQALADRYDHQGLGELLGKGEP
jgi:CheY-like chemotaxis protein